MNISPTVVLSPSRVEGGMKCLRKHALQEICGQHANDGKSPALEFGDRMHMAAGAYWRARREGNPDAAAIGQELLKGMPGWTTTEKHTLALALTLWSVYTAQAQLSPFGTDSEWEVVTIEERKYLPIDVDGTTIALGFQLDRLLRHKGNGALKLVDLKTASRCDNRWENQWPRSLQMKLYSVCIEQTYGAPVPWIVIEGLEKTKPHVQYVTMPQITPEKQAEAIECVKHVARHDAQLLDLARASDGSIEVEALFGLVLTSTPFNPAECWSYNSPCPFLPLCDAEPGERRSLLRSDYHYEQPKHLT